MKLIIFFIFSLILRLTIIFLSKDIVNYDLQSYLLIGEKTLKNINIYPNLAIKHYPYFPLFLYLQSLAFLLGIYLNPLIFLKIIINLFDLGNGYFVYLITRKNLKKTFFYLINPVSILIFSFHGQFDAIPIFFLLLTIYFLKQKKIIFSSLNYSLAVAFKTWPIFFIFVIFPKIKKYLFIIPLFSIPIILSCIYSYFFKTNILNIFYTIIGYRSLFSEWGLGKIIKISFYPHLSQPPIYIQKFLLIIFIFSLFSYSLIIKKFFKTNIIEKIYLLLLFFYVFTFGFSIQYLSWIVPFLIILKTKKILTIMLITFYLLINYLIWINHSLIPPIFNDYFGLILWIYFFILWLSKNRGFFKTLKV